MVQIVWDELAANLQGVKFYVGWMRGVFICDTSQGHRNLIQHIDTDYGISEENLFSFFPCWVGPRLKGCEDYGLLFSPAPKV